MNAIEIYENAIRMFEINGEITLGEFEEMIKPLEDVAPVVHGEWIEDIAYYDENGCPCIVARCSNCGEAYPTYNYCPNCGAKMDGEK